MFESKNPEKKNRQPKIKKTERKIAGADTK